MIYEVRTYDLIVGGVPDTLKAFATCMEKRQNSLPSPRAMVYGSGTLEPNHSYLEV